MRDCLPFAVVMGNAKLFRRSGGCGGLRGIGLAVGNMLWETCCPRCVTCVICNILLPVPVNSRARLVDFRVEHMLRVLLLLERPAMREKGNQ